MTHNSGTQAAKRRQITSLLKFFGAALWALMGVLHGANPSKGGLTILGYSIPQQATVLAIDDYSLPFRKNLCYYLSKPNVRPQPVISPSRDNPHATDTLATHFYGTVLEDGGRFRMWYYGASWLPKEQNKSGSYKIKEGPICYAESQDGIQWIKPDLGQVEWNGGRHNNAIALPDTQTEGAFVIKDENDSDNRRYKMVYENLPGHKRCMSVRTATSADGIHWTAGADAPISEGLEPCSFYRHNGLYYINAQFAPFGVSEGGHKAGRQGFVWVSPDFTTWIQEGGESFLLPEPANPNDRGLDRPGEQVHLGVAPMVMGNVLVGLYAQWHSRPYAGDWFGRATTCADWGLVVSHDGQHFREPVKGHVFLNRAESSPTVCPDVRYETVLCQGNGILNVGGETRIYHGRWVNAEKVEDYYADIGLATLPRDRWGALGLYPHAKEGSVWTAPLTLDKAGCEVTLNADGVQGMRVDIADERFTLLADYSGENAGVVAGQDGLDCAVKWSKGALNPLVGKPLRLRINLSKGQHAEPRLYAAYLTCN
jgi:hypothetical protein